MKLICQTHLSRILGERDNFISHKKGNLRLIGSVKLSGKRYYTIDYAKRLICKLKSLSNAEYNRIINELNNYRP